MKKRLIAGVAAASLSSIFPAMPAQAYDLSPDGLIYDLPSGYGGLVEMSIFSPETLDYFLSHYSPEKGADRLALPTSAKARSDLGRSVITMASQDAPFGTGKKHRASLRKIANSFLWPAVPGRAAGLAIHFMINGRKVYTDTAGTMVARLTPGQVAQLQERDAAHIRLALGDSLERLCRPGLNRDEVNWGVKMLLGSPLADVIEGPSMIFALWAATETDLPNLEIIKMLAGHIADHHLGGVRQAGLEGVVRDIMANISAWPDPADRVAGSRLVLESRLGDLAGAGKNQKAMRLSARL